EADAETLARAIARWIDLYEHVEDATEHVGGNPDACVAHRDHGLRPEDPRAEHDAAAPFRVLRGVVQQVGDYLRQPDWIGIEQHRFGRLGDDELVACGFDDRRARLERAAQHGGKPDPLL